MLYQDAVGVVSLSEMVVSAVTIRLDIYIFYKFRS